MRGRHGVFLLLGCNKYYHLLIQDSVIKILDTLYRDRDYPRFFVLETIARVPYFGNYSTGPNYYTNAKGAYRDLFL